MTFPDNAKITMVSGKVNSALVNSNSEPASIHTITVTAWVTRERTGQKEVVVSKWSDAQVGQSWLLYIDEDDRPCFAIRDANNDEVFTVKAKTQLQGLYQPYHLAAVYDILPNNGRYIHQILVDGKVSSWRWVSKMEAINWQLGKRLTASETKIHLHSIGEGENVKVGDILLLDGEQVLVKSNPALLFDYGYADYKITVDRGVNDTVASEPPDRIQIYRLSADPRGIAVSPTEISIGHMESGLYPFHGSVNEVQILPEVLTEQQIRDSIEATRGRRATRNLQALYAFEEGSGSIIRNASGTGESLNLVVADVSAVDWRGSSAGLALASANTLRSEGPVTKLINAAKASNEITVEAWVAPPAEPPSGLAPLVTLSSGPGERNFTLGQYGNRYHARLQTSDTEHDGSDQPLVYDGVVSNQLVHLAYTRTFEKEYDPGKARFFINGREVCQRRVSGDFSNWDENFVLTLGNYPSGDKIHTWMGAFHLVAIYDRALTPVEILRNFEFGADTNLSPVIDAGPDQIVYLEKEDGVRHEVIVALSGKVADDRLASDKVTIRWRKSDPDAEVTIKEESSPNTTATFQQSGTYILELTADDGSILTVSDQITITVIENKRPGVVITSPSNESIVKIPNQVALEAVVTDDGIPDPPGRLDMIWGKGESEQESGGVTFSPPDSEYTQASFSKPGFYHLRFTVKDGHLEAQDEVALHVYASPVINIETEKIINLPSSATLKGTLQNDGLGGQPGTVIFSWKGDGPGPVLFGDLKALSTTASFKQSGIYTLTVTADNGFVDPVEVSVSLVVNEAPVVKAGSDQVIVLPAAAQLAGVVTDDGLPDPPGKLSIHWEAVSGPAPLQTTVTIADSASPKTTAAFSINGAYVLRLTASDGEVSTSDEVTIVIHQAPVIDAGPDQTVAFKTSCKLDGTLSNNGLGSPAGTVTIKWELVDASLPSRDVTIDNPHALDTTASFNKQGDYRLRLTVNNGFLSSSDEVTIHVVPLGQLN